MSKETAILLISCPDQRGLVAGVANFVYRHNGNMTHAEQHIDAPQQVFFHRVEWELDGFDLAQDEIAAAFREVAEPFGMRWQLHFSAEQARIAIFVSKYDHCLLELLHRHRVGDLPGELVAVVSNHPDLQPLIAPFGVPFHLFPITTGNKRAQEDAELKLLGELKVDVVVLARYMQILSDGFVQCFPNRIINIHHSFLPAFVGSKPYHQAFERGVKLIGATSHYVTSELDDGPIIEQDVCRITHRDSLEELMLKGRDLERQVLARSVRLHLRHRILPYGRKTVVFDGG